MPARARRSAELDFECDWRFPYRKLVTELRDRFIRNDGLAAMVAEMKGPESLLRRRWLADALSRRRQARRPCLFESRYVRPVSGVVGSAHIEHE